ncbi:hypothetical protein OOK13_41840 [Streptomyces sp. NBC_00378]|uniref:hypothetical protein n=1 Tax=unclassified Streptomyces TaxID=2593676 RepID=UPI00225B0D53|nr:MULTISPECIES: hypothetical protein [unclassified Streptomyces]MCX5114877.1 hypothetical protein [Streptomyces sp. NBC_00378]
MNPAAMAEQVPTSIGIWNGSAPEAATRAGLGECLRLIGDVRPVRPGQVGASNGLLADEFVDTSRMGGRLCRHTYRGVGQIRPCDGGQPALAERGSDPPVGCRRREATQQLRVQAIAQNRPVHGGLLEPTLGPTVRQGVREMIAIGSQARIHDMPHTGLLRSVDSGTVPGHDGVVMRSFVLDHLWRDMTAEIKTREERAWL